MQKKSINSYKEYLISKERSPLTIEKYIYDIEKFLKWLKKRKLNKGELLEYKGYLSENFKSSSVNSMIAAINGYLSFLGCDNLKLSSLKVQKKAFSTKEKELTKNEYIRLIKAANENERLSLVMETICATGIRVSELKFITVEALKCGTAEVSLKGKIRTILLTRKLISMLKKYVKKQRIIRGAVFITKNKNPLNRSNI